MTRKRREPDPVDLSKIPPSKNPAWVDLAVWTVGVLFLGLLVIAFLAGCVAGFIRGAS